MRRASPSILWIRQDFRIEDNPALQAAAQKPLIVVYIWDEKDPWGPSGASRWWLHKSLTQLKQAYEKHGVQLLFKKGDPLNVLEDLIAKTNGKDIFWNRIYEPYCIQRDKKIKAFFTDKGINCESFNGSLLVEPWELKTQQSKPYQVFTPFWNALQTKLILPPQDIPKMLGWEGVIGSDSIVDWGFIPTQWGDEFDTYWKPGENYAQKKLKTFVETHLNEYENLRDYPAVAGTSRLSPYLHWGEISPRFVWHYVLEKGSFDAQPFLRQLAWREFSKHLLFHFPDLPTIPLKSSFRSFIWDQNKENLKAWQKGLTGYPFIDAGMRELWRTGWMHNRVRMVVGSFLVKDLLLPWQDGEAWFWDTLVDADLGNNSMGWQWVAGCGPDAAPYFRIFNPITQSKKFDPNGDYIRKWVPELKGLDNKFIHTPWLSPMDILERASINMGETYPYPIVKHNTARIRALNAYKMISY